MNIAAALRTRAESTPDRRAVVFRARAAGAPRYDHLCFAELDAESDRIAAALARAGIRDGMHTALMVRPGPDFVLLSFALFKLGAVLVLVDPGIGLRRLGVCLGEAAPEAFVGIPRAHIARAALGWARRSVRITIAVGGRGLSPGTSLARLRRRLPALREPGPIAPARDDATAAILFTSGSTGVPKGVVYSHGAFAAQLGILAELLPPEAEAVDLATFPPFALFDPAMGVTAVIPEMDASRPARANPAELVRTIRDQGVTRMFASPAVLDRIGRHALRESISLPSLRRVVSAGAPVRPDILERMARRLPPDAEIFTPYGATEALPVTWIGAREILGDTRVETARGGGICVGRPVPGVSVRVIRLCDEAIPSWTDDLVVPAGEPGEIAVAGPNVTRSYHARPESDALAKIRSPDGERVWHRMGDCGRMDAAGRLWFLGRKSHRVETAGGTLFPVACEGIANEHRDVYRSALVGVGPPGAQRPVLCLELEAGVRAEARIVAEVRALLAGQPQTAAIETIRFHRGGFPVDRRHNAKIDRTALARWAARRRP